MIAMFDHILRDTDQQDGRNLYTPDIAAHLHIAIVVAFHRQEMTGSRNLVFQGNSVSGRTDEVLRAVIQEVDQVVQPFRTYPGIGQEPTTHATDEIARKTDNKRIAFDRFFPVWMATIETVQRYHIIRPVS